MAQSTSKQLIQYGATVAGAAAVPALVKGFQAASATFTPIYNSAMGEAGASMIDSATTAGTAALDAGIDSVTNSLTSTFTDPSFLTNVGLGVAGLLLGSGSKRPSLTLPNIAAAAGVALNVGALLKQGQASLQALEQSKAMKLGGSVVGGGVLSNLAAGQDPNVVVAQARQMGSKLDLVFPADLGDRYYMKLSIYPYQRNRSDQTTVPGNPHTTVKLPLPNNIIDAVKLVYQDFAQGMFGGPARDALQTAISSIDQGQGVAFNLGRVGSSLASSLKSLLQDQQFVHAVGRRLLNNSPTLASTVDMLTGTTPNPHMAVTFQGVALKKHTYTWRISPTTENESNMARAIIRQLQAASLPGKQTQRGLLLTFPDVVVVEIDPSPLMMFRPCVLDSVVVNYTPNGGPAFFENKGSTTPKGHPVEMELTLTLREIDIHTNDMEFYNEVRQGQLGIAQPPTTALIDEQ